MKNIKIYVLLHLLLLLFSFSPVFSKLAATQDFLSLPFILYYGASVGILGIYALGWQQIIKRLPLGAAYANRAVAVVWGMVWGLLFFSESISLQKVMAAAVIVCGVLLFAFAQGEETKDAN